MRWSVRLGLGLLLALPLTGCGGKVAGSPDQDAGTDGTVVSPDGGTGGSLESGTGGTGGDLEECKPAAYPDEYCGACMQQACAVECAACQAHSTCAQWLACAMDCSSSACMQGCSQEYPGGEAPATAWFGSEGCLGKNCGASCGGDGSGICGTGATTTIGTTCDACLGASCCEEVNACLSDAVCLECASGGTATSCDGNARYATFETCWSNRCSQACGGNSCGLSTAGENPPCDACISDHCCDEGNACANGPDADHDGTPDCVDVLACGSACTAGDSVCQDACVAAEPAGGVLLTTFFDCLSEHCETECPSP